MRTKFAEHERNTTRKVATVIPPTSAEMSQTISFVNCFKDELKLYLHLSYCIPLYSKLNPISPRIEIHFRKDL